MKKWGKVIMAEVIVQDPYVVQQGDTLSLIAKRSGKTVTELSRLIKLKNPNRLDAGQTLYLSPESAFGVSVQFLDALRHPIENLRYKIKFDGHSLAGKTSSNGTAGRLTTQDASTVIDVWVEDLRGQWVQVCRTASDYGHKIVTLVSGALVFKGATQAHPGNAPSKPESESKAKTSIGTKGAPDKNNPNVKIQKGKGKHGQAVIEVSVDIPEGLQRLFSLYEERPILDKQWIDAANYLSCEAPVLKAIAEVETKGAAFWRLNDIGGKHVPSILFERHWFRRLTKRAYDVSHPDISGPAYTSHKGADPSDRYGSYATSYLRLINAYRLDPEAALASCSWGKFQIMGGEYVNCDEGSARELAMKMCAGESGQIELLSAFIRKKAGGKLWAAVKDKKWDQVALYYNGADYKKNAYDKKLEAAYAKHSKA